MKADQITNSGVLETCAAIIKQAVDDYDTYITVYFRTAVDKTTKQIIPIEKFDYLESIPKFNRNSHANVEISKINNFMESDWFSAIVEHVGDFHPDHIRRIRRRIIAHKLVEKGKLKAELARMIFKTNDWEY